MEFRKKPVTVDAITFAELVQHGRDNGGNIVGGMPWSFKYKGHPITHENDECYLILTLEGTMKFTPNDMLITGVKGEIYPCKMDIFNATYEPGGTLIFPLSFGGALEALKRGERVSRTGWNGKGMWIAMGAAHSGLPAASFWNEHARAHAEANGGSCPVQHYILMKTAQGDIQMGWSPTQSDALAEDWSVV
jgi:hypothetical protein